MKLRRRFSETTKALFLLTYHCFNCNLTKPRDPHHILSTESDSPLNCSPICIDCHAEEHRGKRLDKSKLLIATIKYLVKIDYSFTENDIAFYENNQKYYES